MAPLTLSRTLQGHQGSSRPTAGPWKHLFDLGVLNGLLEVSKVPSGLKMEPQFAAVKKNVNAFSIFITFYSLVLQVAIQPAVYSNKQHQKGIFHLSDSSPTARPILTVIFPVPLMDVLLQRQDLHEKWMPLEGAQVPK